MNRTATIPRQKFKSLLITGLLAMPALILLLGFWVLLSWNKMQDGLHSFHNLRGHSGWEYRIGDIPLPPEGMPSPEADSGWQPLREDMLVSDAIASSYAGYYGLRVRLPEKIRGEGLLLQLRGFKHIQAFIGTRQLYDFNMEPRDFRVNQHLHWGMVPLQLADFGDTLTIRAYHDGSSPVKPGFLIGRAEAFYSDMLAQDAMRIVFCILFLFYAICSFLLFAVNPREPIYLYFGILTACAGYGSIIRAQTLQFFADLPLFVYMQDVAIPVGTGALIGFLARLYPAHLKGRKLLLGLAWSLWGFAVAVCVAALYREPLYHLLINKGFLGIACVYMSIVLVLMARSYRIRRDRETRWVFFGIVLLVLFAAFYYVHINVYSFAPLLYRISPILLTYMNETQMTVGLFLFILCLGVVLILRFTDTMQQIKRVSEELAVKNEQLQEMDRLKDDFLARTSHELRTPLFGIIGMAESLLEPDWNAGEGESRRRLSLIMASGRRLTRLVNDILDLSKMRHNDLRLSPRPVDIRQTADIAVSLLQTQAAAKGLTLRNHIPEGLPPVKADEDRIEQVLLNLVGNAVKFSFEGNVDIIAELVKEEDPEGTGSGPAGPMGSSVSAERVVGSGEPGARFLRVSVADHGLGIPEEDLERIFERFNQSRHTLEQGIGGTGLGLTVSKQLVELHGGTLSVISKEGMGSTFSFTLPLWPGEASLPEEAASDRDAGKPQPGHTGTAVRTSDYGLLSEHAGPPAEEGMQAPPGQDVSNPTILLVDDEPVNLEVLSTHLSPPYRLVTCSLASQALDALEAGLKPDLVITDVMMPGLNGYELTRRIRQTYGEADLPILMLTAKSLPEDLAEGFGSGANDYLTKPVSKRELLARVKLHLKVTVLNRSLEEEVRGRTAELEQRNRELQFSIQETMEALEEIVALEERNRIAHEIHDTVGHTLTATIMQLEATKRLLAVDGERAMEKLSAAQGLVRNGLDQIRSVVRMLKEDAVRTDLRESLTALIAETEDVTGVVIDYDISPLPELPPLYRKVVFHALQEGLTNGLRHGRGYRFQFRLEVVGDHLHFSLNNDGAPYEDAPFGFGLSAMKERVEHLGGSLRVEASPGWGCALQIRLPVS